MPSSRRSSPTSASQTTLLEALPDGVLPIGPEPEIAGVLAKSLARRGHQGPRRRPGRPRRNARDGGLVVGFETPGGTEKIEVDQVLVAIGRRPVTEDLGLDDGRGDRRPTAASSSVDTATMVTSRPGVYAIGDVRRHPRSGARRRTPRRSSRSRRSSARTPVPVDYARVPWVVYTHPEVAWAGLTEPEARAAGPRHRGAQAQVRRQRPRHDHRRDRRDGEGRRRSKDGPILGFHLVGPWASELLRRGLPGGQLAGACRRTSARFIHPHPSLSEAIGETMLTFTGRSLHG